MKNSTVLSVLVAGLPLLLLSGSPAQGHPAGIDGTCAIAHELCSANCTGLGDRAALIGCLMECDNAAALCPGNDPVTISSEDYLAFWGVNGLATKAGACHDTTPCPSEYDSCASWSGYTDCGDPFCGISTLCGECEDVWPYRCEYAGPALKQFRERYRVCWNPQMQGCTEYQRVTVNVGGCGC